MKNLNNKSKLEKLILQELKLYKEERQLLNEGVIDALILAFKTFSKGRLFPVRGSVARETFEILDKGTTKKINDIVKNSSKYNSSMSLLNDTAKIMKKYGFTEPVVQLTKKIKGFVSRSNGIRAKIDDAVISGNIENLRNFSSKFLKDLDNVGIAGYTISKKLIDDLDIKTPIDPDVYQVLKIFAYNGSLMQSLSAELLKKFSMNTKSGRKNIFDFYILSASDAVVKPRVKKAFGSIRHYQFLSPEDKIAHNKIIELRKRFVRNESSSAPSPQPRPDADPNATPQPNPVRGADDAARSRLTPRQKKLMKRLGIVGVSLFGVYQFILSDYINQTATEIGAEADAMADAAKKIINGPGTFEQKMAELEKILSFEASTKLKDSIEMLKQAGVEDETILDITEFIIERALKFTPKVAGVIATLAKGKRILESGADIDPQEWLTLQSTQLDNFRAIKVKRGKLEGAQEIKQRYANLYGSLFTVEVANALRNAKVEKAGVTARIDESLGIMLGGMGDRDKIKDPALRLQVNKRWREAMSGALEGVAKASDTLSVNKMFNFYQELFGQVKSNKYETEIYKQIKQQEGYKDLVDPKFKEALSKVVGLKIAIPYDKIYLQRYAKSKAGSPNARRDLTLEDFTKLASFAGRYEEAKSKKTRAQVGKEIFEFNKNKLMPLINSILIPLGFKKEDYIKLGLGLALENYGEPAGLQPKGTVGFEGIQNLRSPVLARYVATRRPISKGKISEENALFTLRFVSILIPYVTLAALGAVTSDEEGAAAEASRVKAGAERAEIKLIMDFSEAFVNDFTMGYFEEKFRPMSTFNKEIKPIHDTAIQGYSARSPFEERGGG